MEDNAAGRTPPNPVRLLLVDSATWRVPADLEVLANAFNELLEARHGADYDPAFDATRLLGKTGKRPCAIVLSTRLTRRCG